MTHESHWHDSILPHWHVSTWFFWGAVIAGAAWLVYRLITNSKKGEQ